MTTSEWPCSGLPRLAIVLPALAIALAGESCFAQQTGTPSGQDGASVQKTATAGDFSFYLGVRLWVNTFEIPVVTNQLVIPNPSTPTQAVIQQTSTQTLSQYEYVPMPIVGLRWKDLIASASYFPDTTYTSNSISSVSVKRTEADASLGYLVLPTLAVTIGYKWGDLKGLPILNGPIPSYNAQVDAVLLGASGSAPLSDAFSLYGNAAYGWGHETISVPDAAGNSRYDLNYQIAELGLSYRFSFDSFLKALSLTVGYRAQITEVKNIAFGTYQPNNPPTLSSTTSINVRSVTTGPVIGLIGVF